MAITINGLSAGYGGKSIIHGISTRFERGRMTALIGPNGCGKSTLLKAIMGFIRINSGEILLDDAPIRQFRRKELARRVSYLPQEASCPEHMSVGELVELGGYARRKLFDGPSKAERESFKSVLRTVGLSDYASRPVSELSGGQRQRAWLAMVLAQDTDVILMDEPVNHLDVKYQYSILDLVRNHADQYGKTVAVVLHDINLTAAYADNVIMLREGGIIAAGPVKQQITPAQIEAVFDIRADVFERNGRLLFQPYMDSAPDLDMMTC